MPRTQPSKTCPDTPWNQQAMAARGTLCRSHHCAQPPNHKPVRVSCDVCVPCHILQTLTLTGASHIQQQVCTCGTVNKNCAPVNHTQHAQIAVLCQCRGLSVIPLHRQFNPGCECVAHRWPQRQPSLVQPKLVTLQPQPTYHLLLCSPPFQGCQTHTSKHILGPDQHPPTLG